MGTRCKGATMTTSLRFLRSCFRARAQHASVPGSAALAALGLALCASPLLTVAARADLLVLNRGGGGSGVNGPQAVLRFDDTTGVPLGRFGQVGEAFTAMSLTSAGELYVASNTLGAIENQRFNGAGEFLGTAGAGGGAVYRGLEGELYGIVWSADQATGRIVRHGARAATFIATGAGGMTRPEAALLGADGRVYVVDRAIGVLRFDAVTGAWVDVFVPNGRGGLASPWRLAFGPDGRLYVTSGGTQDVRRFDGVTGAWIDTFVAAGRGGLSEPGGLAFGPDGHLCVVSRGTGQVLRYDGASGAFLNVAATHPDLRSPLDIVFTPAVGAAGAGWH